MRVKVLGLTCKLVMPRSAICWKRSRLVVLGLSLLNAPAGAVPKKKYARAWMANTIVLTRDGKDLAMSSSGPLPQLQKPYVGENIAISYSLKNWRYSIEPGAHWSVSGLHYTHWDAGYDHSRILDNMGSSVDMSPTIQFFWVDGSAQDGSGGSAGVRLNGYIHRAGQVSPPAVSRLARFDVNRPAGGIDADMATTIKRPIVGQTQGADLALSSANYGIRFLGSIADPVRGGKLCWVQVVHQDSYRQGYFPGIVGGNWYHAPHIGGGDNYGSGSLATDKFKYFMRTTSDDYNDQPQLEVDAGSPVPQAYTHDAPHQPTAPSLQDYGPWHSTTLDVNENFTMWLMFKPPGLGAEWVPISKIPWSWSGTLTTPGNYDYAAYVLSNDYPNGTTPISSTQKAGGNSTDYPDYDQRSEADHPWVPGKVH